MSTFYQSHKIVWQAEKYDKLSIAQNAASTKLINQLNISQTDKILDVGCGSGKITAMLASKAKKGQTLGVDLCPEMISFANQTYANNFSYNLTFEHNNAENLSLDNQFDLIFSSFALQWVSDKSNFFSTAFDLLEDDGTIALIIPLCVSPEFRSAIDEVIILKQWRPYFGTFSSGWHFESASSIKYLVNQKGFSISTCSEVVEEVYFSSRKELEEYILLWFRYLEPIPNFLKDQFFQAVMDKYYQAMKKQNNKCQALMRIPRLDLVAKKIT